MPGRTRLSWLGTGPVAATPASVKGELEKLAFLRGLDADPLDLPVLPAGRRRFLAGVGRRLTPQHLARREPARRYPILLTLIAQSAVDVLDESLLLFDQALSGREPAARAMMDASMAYLRQFVPDVLAAVRFGGGPGTDDLRQAVAVLAGLYAAQARKVPEGAPDGFVPARWAGYLEKAAEGGRRHRLPALLGAVRADDPARRPPLGGRARPGVAAVRRPGLVPAHPRSGGSRSGWSSAASPARPRPPPTPWRWPATSCTRPWRTWRPSSPGAAGRARSGSPGKGS